MMDGTGGHGRNGGTIGVTGMEGPSVVLPVSEERARHRVALGAIIGSRLGWGIWFLSCVCVSF